jgi:hypothetical protein
MTATTLSLPIAHAFGLSDQQTRNLAHYAKFLLHSGHGYRTTLIQLTDYASVLVGLTTWSEVKRG